MITGYGAQRAHRIRPKCFGSVRARTQMLISQSIHQLYSAGLFSTSVINLSLSKILKSRSMMCELPWKGRRSLLAVRLFYRPCAQACMFFRVPLLPTTAVRPPHRTENEACCVWKNPAVKQPSVGWLAFKTERFIPALKKTLRFEPLVCAGADSLIRELYRTVGSERTASDDELWVES